MATERETKPSPPNSPPEHESSFKAVIKNVDMIKDLQDRCVEVSRQALDQFTIEKDIAAYIKKELDRVQGPTWHVVVGKNFGSYVTHESGYFLYFYIDSRAFLLWKS